MPGILIVLIILLCFAIYIDVERQKYDQKTSEAYKKNNSTISGVRTNISANTNVGKPSVKDRQPNR